MDLVDEFNKCKIKSWKTDPETWLTTLMDLKKQIVEAGGNKTEDDVLEHVMNNMPKEYNVLYTTLQGKIGAAQDPLTVDKLNEEMNLLWKRLKKQRGVTDQDEDDGDETALYAGGTKIRCSKCGKIGHKAKFCRSKDDNKGDSASKKFKGTCFYCHKAGHRKQDCEKRKAKLAEQAKVAADNDSDSEIGFPVIDIETKESDFDFDTNDEEIAFMGIRLLGSNNDESETETQSNDLMEESSTDSIERGYEGFNLGNEWYDWKWVPELTHDPKPKDPQDDWCIGDYYDRPTGWQNNERDYENAMKEWKKRQMRTLNEMSILSRSHWKVQYQRNRDRDLGLPVAPDDHASEEAQCDTDLQSENVARHPETEDAYDTESGTTNDNFIDELLLDQGLEITTNNDELLLKQEGQDEEMSKQEETESELSDFPYELGNYDWELIPDIEADNNWLGNYDDDKGHDLALPLVDRDEIKEGNIFLGDSGASCHMVHSEDGMTDVKETKSKVTIRNGHTIPATMIGNLKAKYVDQEGNEKNIILHDVKVVPDLAPFNLFSMTTALARGFKLGNEGKQIYVQKDGFKLKFDHEIKTKAGYVAGAKIIPRTELTNIAAPIIDKGSKMSTTKFHGVFGHQSMASTKNTAKYYGIQLTGPTHECEACMLGKAKQKNVGKGDIEKRATQRGKRMFFDISSIKNTSYGGSKF